MEFRPPSLAPSAASRPRSVNPWQQQRGSVPPRGGASTRPTTTSSGVGEGGTHVVAIIQGKAAGVELGIAAFNLDTGRMTLTQLSDTSLYARTLQHLYLHYPSDVLVANNSSTAHQSAFRIKTETPNKLVETIEKEFSLKCRYLSRNVWNNESGMEAVKRYCLEDPAKQPFLMVLADRYYALCAAAALFHWTCTKQGFAFNEGSIKIEYETIRGQMFIDSESARNLELVQNNLSMKATNTLFSTLNSCFTPMGSRSLRASILQPGNQKDMINNRLDAVEELINSSEKLRSIRKTLKAIDKIDLDKLISSLSQDLGSSDKPSQTETRIQSLLQLRTVVKEMAELAAALRGCTSPLLTITARVLSDPVIITIAETIDERLSNDATNDIRGSKSQTLKHARLHAVKSGVDPLLDLARSTLKENTEDIMALKEEIADAFGIEHPMMEWTQAGFKFSCFTDELQNANDLPRGMLNIERGKRYTRFTTHELLKRNARMLQTQQEVFVMSDKFIAALMLEIAAYIPSLYQGSDAIGMVDMLTSFAGVSAGQSYTRPTFGTMIAIKNGRHPILEATLPAGDCVPNDVYAVNGTSHFQVIQGPNMSGKSTYLRQIALLTIQGMVGCFLPAEHAILALPDSLLTRLSNDDSMQKSLSTFAAEMATSAMILGMATQRSLVLVDELGRGTSPIEGIGLSQAIAEQLVKQKCFTFFATHFRELSMTLCTTPGVANLHLQVQRNGHMVDTREFSTTFHYKVVEGKSKAEHYGLELAKLAALPPDVLEKAWEVSAKITDTHDQNRNVTLAQALSNRRKAILELRGKLNSVLEVSRVEDPTIINYLRETQGSLFETLQEALRVEQESNSSEVV